MQEEDNAKCEQKIGQVTQQLEHLEKELARANEVRQMLTQKLSPILLIQPPCNPETTDQPNQELTSLATHIRDMVQNVRNLTEEYESILERLEL